MERVKGEVKSIIFYNEENGYTICEILEEDLRKRVTVRGNMPGLFEGVIIECEGSWTVHCDYGEQFTAASVSISMPTSEKGIRTFLGSGLIKGVGQGLSERIVKRFGKNTLSVIENTPELLTAVSGITAKKAEDIAKCYGAYKDSSETLIFLGAYGISTGTALKIYNEFGKNTIETVSAEPFILSERISGIRFDAVDRLSRGLGFPDDNPARVRALILYHLENAYGGGHVFLPKNVLSEAVREKSIITPEVFEEELRHLSLARKIIIRETEEFTAVYLEYMYKAERYIEEKLLKLEVSRGGGSRAEERALDVFEKQNGIRLDEIQREAVLTAVSSGVTVITGGPGTGKTTIIKAVLHILNDRDEKCLLGAPTGRAAKRMTEACGQTAKTIHRLLEIDYNGEKEHTASSDAEVRFLRNSERPLSGDCVIIDEVSMVNTIIMWKLLEAISAGTRLILVGDNDQLPSVGPGRILRDIIGSGHFNVIELKEIYRQSPDSYISLNAKTVNAGGSPSVNKPGGDFFFISPEKQGALATVMDLYRNRLPKTYNIDPLRDIQIILPNKVGETGCEKCNKELQKIINPRKNDRQEILRGDGYFRIGDKVMQTRNNYDLEWTDISDPLVTGEGVFNGEMGIIIEAEKQTGMVTVLFDDSRYVNYDRESIADLELAYAITVHKSQGSEFEYCIICVSNVLGKIKTRNLIYTAITRAKKMCIIVGTPKELADMIENNSETRRYTSLFENFKSEAI